MNSDDSGGIRFGNEQKSSSVQAKGEGGMLRALLAGGIFIVLAAIVFGIFAVQRRERVASQADTFARTLIQNSPVVQEQLGKVEQVEKLNEHHETGIASGWYLDYDVIGRHARGVVDMRLTPGRSVDNWNVVVADLGSGQKSVNLR